MRADAQKTSRPDQQIAWKLLAQRLMSKRALPAGRIQRRVETPTCGMTPTQRKKLSVTAKRGHF